MSKEKNVNVRWVLLWVLVAAALYTLVDFFWCRGSPVGLRKILLKKPQNENTMKIEIPITEIHDFLSKSS